MAVSVRGYVALSSGAVGRSVSWPAGTAAGDLAVAVALDSAGSAAGGYSSWSGWSPAGAGVHWRVLTAADVASAWPAPGPVVGLVVLAGASTVSWAWRGPTARVSAGGALVAVGVGPSPLGGATGRQGSEYAGADWSAGVWAFASAVQAAVGVSSPQWDAEWVGLVVSPATAPTAPLLVSPVGAQVATGVTVPLVWSHQSVRGGAQEAYAVQVRPVAGSWSYLTAGGTLSGSVQQVTSASQGATVGAGVLAAGAYEWTVSTMEAGVWSAVAPVAALSVVAAPSVSSVSVSSPVGVLSPGVSWTAAAGYGSLSAWQVRVTVGAATDPGVPLWDSGVQSGNGSAASVPTRDDWTNGASYKAWVRVAQSGGLWSAWVSASFVVSWTAPASPGGVSMAQGAPPTVTVSGLASGSGVDIEWTRDGVVWESVASLPSDPATSRAFPLPLAPYGVAVTVRARAVSWLSGVRVWSAWVSASAFTSTDAGAYLVADGDQSTYLPVDVESDGPRVPMVGVAVWSPLGGSRPCVDRGADLGDAGSCTLIADSAAEAAALRSWLLGRDVWWLRWWPEGGVDVPPTRMAFAGGGARERLAQVPIALRRVSLDWVEQ